MEFPLSNPWYKEFIKFKGGLQRSTLSQKQNLSISWVHALIASTGASSRACKHAGNQLKEREKRVNY